MGTGFEEKEKKQKFLKTRLWGENVLWTEETLHVVLFNVFHTPYHPCNLVQTSASF